MAYRLELRDVTKRYAGVLANESVSFGVAAGEIHAVLGENGAGKSTLMKIIYGAIQADAGEMLWHGTPVVVPNPAAARRLGIGMVYQHFSLFESITVVENIAVAVAGRYDPDGLAARVVELGERYGLEVDPHRLLHHLSVGERQRVEILRCLLQDPQLLILDEPTSVLTPQAARRLFAVLRTLAAGGCSILYISHKLEEIRELCDGATVLRAGRVVGTAQPKRASTAELARLMVGAPIPAVRRERVPPGRSPRLEVRQLSTAAGEPFAAALHAVSLAVHGGEIVGIAGVSGNGQQELLALLDGERRGAAGSVLLDGAPVGHLDAGARRRLGIAVVPEDRQGRGAVAQMTLADNALLTAHRAGLVRRGWIDRRAAGRFARGIIERFGVRGAAAATRAAGLSGGNLQKFIVGRELSLEPRVLIVAQPTWGVDVAASAFLRQCLVDSSRRGAAVLVVSEEVEELLEICDRIAVMFHGRLSAAMPRDATGIEEIGLLMTGVGTAFESAA